MDSDATGSFNVVYGKILIILEFGSRKKKEYGTENGGGTGLLYGADSRWEDLPRWGQSASNMPSGPCQLPPHPMHLTHPFHPSIPLEPPSGLGIDGSCLSLPGSSPAAVQVALLPWMSPWQPKLGPGRHMPRSDMDGVNH